MGFDMRLRDGERERGVDDKKGISCGFGIYFNSTNIHTTCILIS